MGGALLRALDRAVAGLRVSKTLGTLTFITTAGLCLVAGLTLKALHDDAWERAEASAQNILMLIEQDAGRNIELFDLSLAAVMDGMALPGLSALTPEMRHAVLFDRAATARYLGAILVLDVHGNVVLDSRSPEPRVANYKDRDYFQHHAMTVDRGLYVSRPYMSSRTGGLVIGLSRRLQAADGSFSGVIVGTMQLAYFGDLFSGLDVGPKGSLMLYRPDGTVLMRKPHRDSAVGSTILVGDAVREAVHERRGTVTARSPVDGVERRFAYARVGDLPLYVNVGLALDDIFAAWWRKAVAIGAVVACLCGVAVLLNALLLGELRERRAVEARLQAANAKLARLALTDPLTGLGNRRRFDQILARDWAGTREEGREIALVIVDADHFKAYNDGHGHQAGDAVLQRVAAELGAVSAASGREACRIGGEEFAVVAAGLGRADILAFAETVRAAVEARAIPHAASGHGVVTISVGIGLMRPGPCLAPSLLIEAADSALYRAKAEGRNRSAVVDGDDGHGDLARFMVPISASPQPAAGSDAPPERRSQRGGAAVA